MAIGQGSELPITPIKTSFMQGGLNKFNKSDPTTMPGYYLNSVGNYVANVDYLVTHKIPCNNGDVIRCSNPSNEVRNGALYNINGQFLASIPTASIVDGYFEYTVNNANAKYFAISTHWQTGNNINNFMVIVNNLMPTFYEAFNYVLPESYNNPLYGKVGLFDGDSICSGAGYTGGYANIIAAKNGMTIVNYGAGGATITTETYDGESPRHWICDNIATMQTNADYIILQGGINDYWNSVTMGEITTGYVAELNEETFCGAFESMLKQAIAKWPGKKLGFIISHKIYDTAPETYWVNARAICEKWSVPYLDLFNMGGLNGLLADHKTNYTKDADGCHPNEAGYRYFLVPKIEAWMKTL